MYPILRFVVTQKFIFFNLLSAVLLYSVGAEVQEKCGQRPFCQKLPELCKKFTYRLLNGFIPGEMPFIARIAVTENILHGNSSLECIAVILSHRDLILNTKCFELLPKDNIVDGNHTESTPIEDVLKSQQQNQYRFENHINYLFSSELALITLPENDENFATDEIQNSCIESVPEFQIDGIVCGFSNEPAEEELEISCRTLKIYNEQNGEHKTKIAASNQKNYTDDLRVGAAVFRHYSAGEDDSEKDFGTWKLIGFTNSEGGISTLSPQDCETFILKTDKRVKCDSIDSADLIPPTTKPPFYLAREEQEQSQGSAVIPVFVFGLILVLGVVLCASAVRNSRNNANYDII